MKFEFTRQQTKEITLHHLKEMIKDKSYTDAALKHIKSTIALIEFDGKAYAQLNPKEVRV